MPTIRHQVRIDAAQQHVWNLLADFGNVYKFNPGVKHSHATNDREGLGASRQCELLPMGVVQERVVEYRDGEEMLIEIFEGKNMPPVDFDETRARLTVHREDDATVVTMELDYHLKGLLGYLMAPMVATQFAKAVPNILNGLKVYAETGSKVSREQLKALNTVPAAA